ncbi:MAG: extracellular solute-binding protein [Parcubacteria group bacterium]|nr:extracellular solute-binding protein [Parcubacteria group bacterium]
MKLSFFQVAVIGVFALFAIAGVILFALGGAGGGGKADAAGPVLIWGTYDDGAVNRVIEDFRRVDETFDEVSYVEKNKATFTGELVDALASGTGPDLFFLDNDLILRHRDKIIPIPYDILSERDFRNAYIEGAELFLDSDGLVAVPTSIDPMVLYWNRSLFSSSGLALPPEFWDEVLVLSSEILTKKDQTGNISQSAIAFGEYQNIKHAKEILSMLITQAGGSVVSVQSNGGLASGLGFRFDNGVFPAESALRLYTDFANPSKSVYSWNRSLSEAREEFVAGNLAMYIGFASELREIRALNPNLNFDVSPVPQSRDGRVSTYGNSVGLSIPRGSLNINGAARVALALSSKEGNRLFTETLNLTSPRRDILTEASGDLFETVFRRAAIVARGWLDPDTARTDTVFREMVEFVTTGRLRVSEAVKSADRVMESLLR